MIPGNTFQSGLQHRWSHDIEIGTQVVDHFHRSFQFFLIEICTVGDRIGKDFIETTANQESRYFFPQELLLRVRFLRKVIY